MGFGFYFNTALKNITNSKKQSTLYVIGIAVSIMLLLSLQLWSSTAEDLAAEEFLENQDYELKITSYLYQDLPNILSWLNQNKPLIELTSTIYYNIALFNAEDKSITYRFMPENNQEDMNDPVSVTALALFQKSMIPRISSQFLVRGEFALEENEVLISEYEAAELERVYGYSIEPGMKINVSIARRGPELGEVFLYHCELKHFYNVTVRGIYRTIPTISMLQKTFSSSFLKDSIIFLKENMDAIDINQMESNGLEPIFMSKCSIDELKKDGIDQILEKLENIANQLKLTYQSSQTIILDTPVITLEQSYSLARVGIVFALPVVITSMILSIFITNIVIEIRRKQIDTLKDRGGQKWQIIGLLLLEFLILTFFAIIIGVGLSYILASLIPAFASGTLSWSSFSNFIGRVTFPFTIFFYITLGIVLIIGLFTIVKSNFIFENNLEEKQKIIRDKIQKWIVLGLLLVCTLTSLILTIIYGYFNFGDTRNIYNFSLEQTQDNVLVFLFIILLILLISIIASLFLPLFLGKMKKLYNFIAPKNSFFITNSLKKSRTKFSSLLIILIILTSMNIFSLSLYITNNRNVARENYYNTGADIRIQTSYINYEFANNISQIEGINQAIPVLFADGKLIYNTVTVIGINPLKYYDIGRWEYNIESDEEIHHYLELLNQTENGAIVSDVVANRLNLSIGKIITVTGLPNGSNIETFNVTGILHTAPGFGLTYGINLELRQSNQEIMIINEQLMRRRYAVIDTNLFFASKSEGYDIGRIKSDILAYSDVLAVNPEIINEQFIGKYIDLYIPKVSAFLLAQIILMNIIGIIIIATNIEFLLSERKKNNAIMNTIGNSNRNLGKQIAIELLVVLITAILFGLIIGIPFAALVTLLNRPIFSSHNILAYNFTFDYIGIPLFAIALIAISLITIIPSLVSFRRENIAKAIRA